MKRKCGIIWWQAQEAIAEKQGKTGNTYRNNFVIAKIIKRKEGRKNNGNDSGNGSKAA